MKNILVLSVFVILFSCKNNYYAYQTFEYPKKVDTRDKNIEFQQKKVFKAGEVYASNQFEAARLNDFKKINDSTYEALILPENKPINKSPWFAFRVWSENPDTIYIKLKYEYAKHRYIPKYGQDKHDLKPVDKLIYSSDSSSVIFPFFSSRSPQYIAAQEIISSKDVADWMKSMQNRKYVTEFKSIGESVLGRKIPYLKLGKGDSKNKKVIVLMSRQHPPEISGFKALQYFIDEITWEDALTQDFFDQYEVWVFPLLNPDGVDLGHWRHNAHGIDLNRDWAYYRQPEIKQVTDFIRTEAQRGHNKIVLGIDFHSTQEDVYYVFDDHITTNISRFRHDWTSSIDRLVYPHKTEYAPFPLSQSISKNWFFKQFGAEAVTYEMGDEVPDNMIQKKSKAAAVSMMDLLINIYK
jgi:hypothetical protein